MAAPMKELKAWSAFALKTGYLALRYKPWRRRLMFYVSIAAMVQLTVGWIIMETLMKSLTAFTLYWGLCGCLVLFMLLLALYDMLAVKQEQSAELKRLSEKMLAEQQETLADADDSGNSREA